MAKAKEPGTAAQMTKTVHETLFPKAEGPRLAEAAAFGRILVGTDGSEASGRALDWARALRGTFDSDVVVATVLSAVTTYDFMGGAMGSFAEAEHELGEDVLAKAAAALGDPAPETVLAYGSPWRELKRMAEERDVDLVVVGSHGRGRVKRLLLGSVADGVKNHMDRHLLIAKTAGPPKRVLLPIDGSSASAHAARLGLRAAFAFDAEATFLHVVPAPELLKPQTGYDEFIRESAKVDLPEWRQRSVTTRLAYGPVGDQILKTAKDLDADLIAMGTTGQGAFQGTYIGSASNRVAHEAEASVLLCRTR